MEKTRRYTATVLVVYKDRVLLHWHKKLKRLLPVGGHVDPDELPEEAALREVKEETGLSVKLHMPNGTTFPDVRALIQPMHILLIDINPYHQLIDFVYYAQAEADRVQPSRGESSLLHWFSYNELLQTKMPENVRILALEALDLFSIMD